MMIFVCHLPLLTKDINRTLQLNLQGQFLFLLSSSAGTNSTRRQTGKILFHKYTSVASCITRVSHSKNQSPSPCSANSCQSREESKMVRASTDRPSAGGTTRHSALLTESQNTDLNKPSGLTDIFGLREFITHQCMTSSFFLGSLQQNSPEN